MRHDLEFGEMVDSTLNLLYQRLGFKTLMVTRTIEDDWIVVRALDQGEPVEPGEIFSWSDSICCRMVQDLGPMMAGDVEEIPAYRDAPIRQIVPCRSYFGFPLVAKDGRLLGTLCGMDPDPRRSQIESEMSLMMTFAQSLGMFLDAKLELVQQEREMKRVVSEAHHDSLTGLLNRRGWDAALLAEEQRHALYISPGAILMIDMDRLKEINDTQGHQAGDEAIIACVEAIKSELGEHDVAARLGGDEFAVLLTETSGREARKRHLRMVNALYEHGVEASVGIGIRTASISFAKAAASADKMMYASKARRRSDGDSAPDVKAA